VSNVGDCQEEILDFSKEKHRLDLEVKNLWIIYRLAYWGFYFFVTSTSGPVTPQSTCLAVLASSELLTPRPLSIQQVCPSPAPKAKERTHSLGGEGVGGQYFGRRQTLDWPLTV
jgi:hypothetical protein